MLSNVDLSSIYLSKVVQEDITKQTNKTPQNNIIININIDYINNMII